MYFLKYNLLVELDKVFVLSGKVCFIMFLQYPEILLEQHQILIYIV
uniref:Uncharacterized protein n=1 Tax=Lepeophtheirus salmonis TaxID=72036 RepID=A0A0K2V738_LEPSM